MCAVDFTYFLVHSQLQKVMFLSKHHYLLKTKDRENRKTVFEIATTQPIFAFVPIHLTEAELFPLVLSSGVKTVDGPSSFLYNFNNFVL